MPAPLKNRGGLLPKEKLFAMASGINDHRYVWTLQALAEGKKAAARAGVAGEAERFLQQFKEKVPLLPEVKNLADLAAVREGIGGGEDLEAWKKQIAEYLVQLQRRGVPLGFAVVSGLSLAEGIRDLVPVDCPHARGANDGGLDGGML